MFTASDVTQSETITIIDPEEPTETARQMLQNRLLHCYMGGLLPEQTLSAPIHHMLDLACGPGGWVLDAAFANPQAEVVGIDRSQVNVQYARAQARSQRRANAHFQVMDILHPLDFPDDYFDLINARFLNTFLSTHAWPNLLHSCVQILSPGGIMRLVECDYGVSSSLACEKLSEYYVHALQNSGLRSTPAGRPLAVGQTVPLDDLLYECGFRQVQQRTYTLDFSAESEANIGMVDNALIFLRQIKPFIVQKGGIDTEEFERLYQEACLEMRSQTFCGQWLIEIIWGKKM
jgi:SAM-dependent methyltransferase